MVGRIEAERRSGCCRWGRAVDAHVRVAGEPILDAPIVVGSEVNVNSSEWPELVAENAFCLGRSDQGAGLARIVGVQAHADVAAD
jgi:hypothetical protein